LALMLVRAAIIAHPGFILGLVSMRGGLA
jgi:hypothetical protein